MSYNLLRYGANNSFCNPDCKDQNLKIIFNEVKPDLIAVNEVLDNGNNANIFTDRILANCLNIEGETAWKKGEVFTGTGQGITNALFYNSEKIGVVSMTRITKTRSSMYKCYFKSSTLATEKDTIFFHVVPVHLKAGSTDNDRAIRERETDDMMEIFSQHPDISNLFMMGDFNMKGSSELAFQYLTHSDRGKHQFHDPINRLGEWNSNRNFADIHTQSPRTQNEADGGSTGGMDDRFDMILVNTAVINNAFQIRYTDNTYRAVGNDGTVLNKNILEAQNVGFELKNALYKASDHLPVEASFSFKGVPAGQFNPIKTQYNIHLIQNPITEQVRLRLSVPETKIFTYKIDNFLGQTFSEGFLNVDPTSPEITIDAQQLPAGIWLLTLSENDQTATFKFVKE